MLCKNAIFLAFYLTVGKVVKNGVLDDVLVAAAPTGQDIEKAVIENDLNGLKEISEGNSKEEEALLKTGEDTATPTEQDTATPTEQDTATPTEQDTATPTEQDTATPTEQDTATPTEQDTATSTEQDTATPTEQDTATPTEQDTSTSTDQDTATPTEQDTATSTEQDTATATNRDIVEAVTGDKLDALKEILEGKSKEEKEALLKNYYDGETLLEMAVRKRNAEMVKALLEAGAPAKVITFSPRVGTILNVAAVYGDAEIMGALLERIDDEEFINRPDHYGCTAMIEAVKTGDLEMVKKLADKGGKVTMVYMINDEKFETAVHDLSEHGTAELYEYLKKEGAEAILNEKNSSEQTALMLAARAGNAEMVKALLADGAEADAASWHAPTALHYAVKAGKKEVVEILLEHGVDMYMKNRNRRTPMDIANDEILEILKAEERKRKEKSVMAYFSP